MKVTQDDLLDALRGAMAKPAEGDASTVQDMADSTGRPVPAIRRGLKALAKEGRLDVVMVRRLALDGRAATVPGYRIKPKAKAGKAA